MSKKVLVVDDSPTQIQVVRKALEGKGFQVITASNGQEALDKLEKESFDLMLLDVIMPNVNGYQVARQAKTNPATKKMPIIMMSSKNQEMDVFWGKKQGADEYLTKPFDEKQLLDLVARYI